MLSFSLPSVFHIPLFQRDIHFTMKNKIFTFFPFLSTIARTINLFHGTINCSLIVYPMIHFGSCFSANDEFSLHGHFSRTRLHQPIHKSLPTISTQITFTNNTSRNKKKKKEKIILRKISINLHIRSFCRNQHFYFFYDTTLTNSLQSVHYKC